MKKKVLIAMLAAAMVAVSGCGSPEVDEAYNEALSQAQEEFDAEYEKQLAALENSTESESSGQETQTTEEPTEAPSEEPAPEDGAAEEPAENPDEPPETGVYEVDGITVNYYSSVRNDVTGNWRVGVVADGTDLETYVVDYYKFFCRDDSEVHGLVNLSLKTTARITKVMSDTLDVSVMEYQDGEEHDADLLFTGDEVEHYWINMDTLEVDPVEEGE